MTIEFEDILNVPDDLVERVRNWRNSNHVNQYMITNHYITKAEHSRWIKKLKTRDATKAWIIRYNKKPVGLVSLSNIDYSKKTTEWGFYIAEESVRRRGIGSAVLYWLIEYVFDTLNFQTMSTMVLENNPVALQMYEKFGFKKENATPQTLERNGKTITVFIMSLQKEEWNNIKEKRGKN